MCVIRELQADAVVPEIHTTLSQNTNLDDLLCSLQCKENIATLRTFFLCPVYSIAHHIHKLPILLSILSFLILLPSIPFSLPFSSDSKNKGTGMCECYVWHDNDIGRVHWGRTYLLLQSLLPVKGSKSWCAVAARWGGLQGWEERLRKFISRLAKEHYLPHVLDDIIRIKEGSEKDIIGLGNNHTLSWLISKLAHFADPNFESNPGQFTHS